MRSPITVLTTVLTTVLFAVLTLAGCSSGGGDAAPSSTSSAPAVGQDRAGYLREARPLYPSTNTDADLLRGGRSVCTALDTGNDYPTLLASLGEVVPRAKAERQIAAAVTYLCPGHKGALPS